MIIFSSFRKLIYSKKISQVFTFILVGISMIFFSIILHSCHIIQTENSFLLFLNELFVQIFSHVGIGFFVAAIVSIMLDLNHWTKYFESRLKKIILDKEYLKELEPNQLISLQGEVLKVYFDNDSIGGDDGFLKYYQGNIQSIIGSPYRLDASMDLKIENHDTNTNLFIVNETLIYTCRKNKTNMQSEIIYEPDEHEHFESFSFEVKLMHENINENGEKFIVFDQSKLKGDSTTRGFRLNITKFNYDNLNVVIIAKYSIIKSRFFAWRMSHPTKNIILSIDYPKNYALESEFFIHEKSKMTIHNDKNNGFYSLRTRTWLMPDEGFTFELTNTDHLTKNN